jgi:hypothetical protein
MADPPHGVVERAREELRKYAGVSAYLYVCFAAILFYRWAMQGDEAVRAVHWGTAAAKALILGKFLLIGEAVHAGERVASRTRLQRIAWRTVALAALLVALTVVEEIVVGWFHGGGIAQMLGELRERPLAELAAEALLVLLVLVPLVTVEEMAKALGSGALMRLLRSPAQGTDQHPPGGTPVDRSR